MLAVVLLLMSETLPRVGVALGVKGQVVVASNDDLAGRQATSCYSIIL